MMFARQRNGNPKISKTAAALNYWLQNERNDLPLEITRISFASYNTPITTDGTLPVSLFGGKLNLKRLKEKKIPWLICYGTHDDLVEKETALAPLDHVDAEVTPFPKGHVAIATSWSSPQSACALHTRFGDGDYRGPVRFQMDLDGTVDKTKNLASKASRKRPAALVQPDVGSVKPKSLKKVPATRKKMPKTATRADRKSSKSMPAAKKAPKLTAKAKPAKTKKSNASRSTTTRTANPSGGKNPK